MVSTAVLPKGAGESCSEGGTVQTITKGLKVWSRVLDATSAPGTYILRPELSNRQTVALKGLRLRDLPMIKLKRAYEEPAGKDGFRILVERLWPRGLSKEKAKIQWWAKEIAPSAELRKWYGHDLARWKEFKKRYWQELKEKEESLGEIRSRACERIVTFVYAARDEKHNSAMALKEFLEK